MPDKTGLLIHLGLRIEVVIDRRQVAGLSDIDAPEMADAGPIVGPASDADVELIVANDGGGHGEIAIAAAAGLVDRFLGIAVELPDEFSGLRLEGIEPPVAARKNHLRFAIHHGVGGVPAARP